MFHLIISAREVLIVAWSIMGGIILQNYPRLLTDGGPGAFGLGYLATSAVLMTLF